MNPSPYYAPFTSAHDRARIVKILLIVGGVAAGMSLLAESISLAVPPLTEDQELEDNPMGVAISLVVFLVSVFEVMIYWTTVVFFLMWLYRSYDNLRAFAPWRRLNYSAGWAVGSFFIPFYNLVVPYRCVREVWQKSLPPDEGLLAEPDPPASFPLWWMFWLLASFVGKVTIRLTYDESVSPSTASIMFIVASSLDILAAIFLYLVVDAIDKRQEETSAKLKLKGFVGPPPPPTNLQFSDIAASTPNQP